ncbi:macrophage mannose receptor 1-like [Neocloeon triangulifer]|uniref:macrophage mannose receptor 1-like n=1 Tax=Neocloeon triangulifer TaxID=2078957 RepID=UPI00286F4D80|nr:macrophage mannose receptor 1-like [Neocloeon triangulifer]
MSGKTAAVLCGIFALFVFIQAHGQTKVDHGKSAESRGYVNVNGTVYYIDTFTVHRDEAKVECEARNMSLISFHQTPEKFDYTVSWLFTYGYEWDWMWTGALKEVNSSVWIWEPTGEEFSYFRWGPDQPSVNDDSIRTCMDFNSRSAGWDDDDCEQYLLGFICE